MSVSTQLRRSKMKIGLASLLVCWMGCSSPPAAAPRAPAPAPTENQATENDPKETGRQELTSEQCQAQGGDVVGDIGDGATRRPDYVCPGGKPPTGNIAAPQSGPMPVEGAVCCPR